jgi:hypothetical protein
MQEDRSAAMNSFAGLPAYCESCGKWLGSATKATDPNAPTHNVCPDCLARTPAAEAERPARDENPSGLVLMAGAATAATAGLLALILRELRNSR